MVTVFLWLIFAHLIADYPLQGDFLANMKGKNIILLVTHTVIWTGTITLALKLLGYHPNGWEVSFLFMVHVSADKLKASKLMWYKHMDALTRGLLIDQLIHVGQILFVMWQVGA